MKFTTTIIFLLSLLLLVSCSDDESNPQESPENSEIIINDSDISFNLVNLKWPVVTGENNETIVYDIYLGDTKIKDSNTDTDYTLTKLDANTDYTGRIVPKTTDDSRSKNKVFVELPPIPFSLKTKQFADPNAPIPQVSNLTANNITNNSATLNWDTATISDNSTITYTIYVDGDLVSSDLIETSYIFENLEPDTTYSGVLLAISTNQKSAALDFEFTTLPDPSEVPLTGFTFFRGTTTSFEGKSFVQLIPIFTPANANAVDLVWTSSDETIASVDKSGYVTTKNIGITTITATSVDTPQITVSIELTVTEPRPIGAKFISAQPKRSSLLVNDSKKIQVNKFNIETGSADDSFTFTSSDPTIASVDADGNVTGLQEGTVAITVTSTVDTTISASIMLRIVRTPIPISSFTFFSENPKTLFTGESQNVFPRIEPEDATNKDIIFTSTDPNVMEISSGPIAKAVGVGNASVIVTSVADNSISAVRDFIVIEDPTSYDEITGVYKAPANSKVTLQIYGFGSLAQDIDPNSIFIESTFSVKKKNGEEILDASQQNGLTITYVTDTFEGITSFNIETERIEFIMPNDEEVTIEVSLIIYDSANVFVSFADLTIDNDSGVRKSATLRNDQIILN